MTLHDATVAIAAPHAFASRTGVALLAFAGILAAAALLACIIVPARLDVAEAQGRPDGVRSFEMKSGKARRSGELDIRMRP
jgi:hypothetical protein